MKNTMAIYFCQMYMELSTQQFSIYWLNLLSPLHISHDILSLFFLVHLAHNHVYMEMTVIGQDHNTEEFS